MLTVENLFFVYLVVSFIASEINSKDRPCIWNVSLDIEFNLTPHQILSHESEKLNAILAMFSKALCKTKSA